MTTTEELAYPGDWQEQGWCCRSCAVTAWSAMSPELRSMTTTTHRKENDHQ